MLKAGLRIRIRISVKSWIRIRIKVKTEIQERPNMEPWRVSSPVVTDSHHFGEEQDPDPERDTFLSEKLDLDPH
jgi:hypothetical protein